MRENGSLWPHEALHCMEKWVQKRAAVGTGLMEGVTQQWDHEASADLEIKEDGELPPWRGEFFQSSEHTHGKTNKSIWGLEMTRLSRQSMCHRRATFTCWKNLQVPSIPWNRYPSSVNMINVCTSISHFHPITYFVHV